MSPEHLILLESGEVLKTHKDICSHNDRGMSAQHSRQPRRIPHARTIIIRKPK
jgi:hypothetical protein